MASSLGQTTMISKFEDIPRRIFLDSSALQTLQTYDGFLYENEALPWEDRIRRDPKGILKLEALRVKVKNLLRRYHYLLDRQEAATTTVL